MAEGNLSAVLYKANDLRLEQRPIPEPKENEVLLRMGCVSICGSDVHYLTKGHIGNFIVKQPMIIGHEASAVVEKLGPGVKNLKKGDRVAIEPGVPCRTCNYCKEGRYNLCQTIFFCATPPDNGNLSRFYVHAADFCHKLPDHVSLEEGALLEPFSVGVHACRRAGVALGSVVLILGAGPVGLLTLIAAKAMGADKVIITDLVAHRLELAKKCGADFVVQIPQGADEQQTSEKISHLLGGEQPNISIDCCAVQFTVRLGLQTTRPGGVLCIVGMGADQVTLPMVNATFREVDIRNCFRYCNDYPLALALVASGKANVKRLITHNFALEETTKAFETAISGDGNPIKIVIHCNKQG